MKEFWERLAPRERAMLIGVGLVLACVVYFLAVLEPLANARQRASKGIAAQQADRAFLEDAAMRLRSLRPAAPSAAAVTDSDSMLTVLNSSAAEAGLGNGLRRINSTSATEASLGLESVPYSALMAWLLRLRNEYGIEVLRIAIERTNAPSVVNVQLTVTNGPQTS